VLSIAGVMGGEESEVGPNTRNILLEGAAWNFINIRRTVSSQHLNSEAAFRFSRGVHPAMAERGVLRCLEVMRQWAGGEVAPGVIDAYPLPPRDPVVEVTPQDVKRWLGIDLSVEDIAGILYRLQFAVEVHDNIVRAQTPDHRLDISEGITGIADLMEEIARIYGYENIPETRMADELPPQQGNPELQHEEALRDVLAGLGLQEVVTYRMTTSEREARRFPAGQAPEAAPYVRLANPISSDRVVMRRSLLASLLEVVERNARLRERIAVFEIGPVYLSDPEAELPQEPLMLALALTGPRALPSWQPADTAWMDFYDLKGVVEVALVGLHLTSVSFEPAQDPTFHPGKCARVLIGGRSIGIMGELSPLVIQQYDLPESPLLAAEFSLAAILAEIQVRYPARPVPAFPPAIEDLAVIVDESLPASQVEAVIRQGGGSAVTQVELFDLYRGGQVGAGKKSLAYRLTYQAPDHTLTDKEITQIRQRIIRRLESELDAHLRS
jgi:phenylalanyl-tRNA synthetase beta chain